MKKGKRLLTWSEALASVREGAGEQAEREFAEAIEIIMEANGQLAEIKRRKEDAVATAEPLVNEYIGDAQFLGPDGVIYERQTGASVSYPIAALKAAGVADEQIAQARKETPWATVAAARS